MKFILSILIFTFIQDSNLIILNEFYSGKGVIFDDSVNYPFIEDDYVTSYVPTIDEVKKAEIFISENYFYYENTISDFFKTKSKNSTSRYRDPKNVIKKYRKFNRQYISYINDQNDTIIYVGLLNFKNKQKADFYFNGWTEMIMAGSGGFYSENQKYFVINLTKKKFVYKVAGMEKS